MNNQLLQSIESFPPLSESIDKLNELCGVEEINLKLVVQTIESDPILYTDILRYANAPYYGFRHPITSISQAISLFGIAAIRGMALTAALKAHPYADVKCYGVSVSEWFAVMEKQQHFLEVWLGKKHRDILQALGGLTFILEIGRLVSSYLLMLMGKEVIFVKNKPNELVEEEVELFGYCSDSLAAKLFEFWHFDPLFVNALKNSLQPKNGIDPKICAALQCARTLFTLQEDQEFDEITAILEEYGFHGDDALTAYEIVISRM